MKREEQYATIEAVLFAVGESVRLYQLADVIGEESSEAKKVIQEMIERYEEEDRGITITEFNGAYQMCSKPRMHQALIRIVKSPKQQLLTETMIETLSIVAYKQPVTRIEVEKIRGVSCVHSINKLIEYDLVKELGRMNAPGKPLLFGTTEQFLRTFGVTSLSELPTLDKKQMEAFQLEVEEEVKLQLPV